MVKEEIRRCWNDENNYIEIAKCIQNILSSAFEKRCFQYKMPSSLPINSAETSYLSVTWQFCPFKGLLADKILRKTFDKYAVKKHELLKLSRIFFSMYRAISQ